MFGKKLAIRIKDNETIEFCKVLGMYGIKFNIGDVRFGVDTTNLDDTVGYRIFTFRASKRKIRELYGEFSMMRDNQFNSYTNRGSA